MSTTAATPAAANNQLDQPVDVRSLGDTLAQIPYEHRSESEATKSILEIIGRLYDAQDASYFQVASSGEIRLCSECSLSAHASDAWQAQATELATLAAAEKTAQSARLQNGILAIAIPVIRHQKSTEAFTVILNCTNKMVPGIVQNLQLFAAYFGQWRGRDSQRMLEVQSKLQKDACRISIDDPATNMKTVANRCSELLRNHFQAKFAAILLKRSGTFQVTALSGTDSYDVQSEFIRAVQEAAHEVAVVAETDTSKLSMDLTNQQTDAVKNLMEIAKCNHVQAVMLRNTKNVVIGIGILMGETGFPSDPPELQFLSPMLGSQLELRQWAQPGPVRRLIASFRDMTQVRSKQIGMLTALCLAFLLVIPTPLRLKCNCTIEPQKRRFLVAPFDGRLANAFFDLGDNVQQHEVVARMDHRDIDLELLEFQTKLKQAQMEEQASRAAKDYDHAGVLADEQKRLQTKIDRLQSNRRDREISSPTNGQLIDGELKRLVGQTVRKGQTLAEIASLDELMFEISIPDSDVLHVSPGKRVHVKMDALPGHVFKGIVHLVRPRSEQRDYQNVFVAEVLVENAVADLRPGMKGRAKIICDSHPIVWNLFHKAWDRLWFRLGW